MRVGVECASRTHHAINGICTTEWMQVPSSHLYIPIGVPTREKDIIVHYDGSTTLEVTAGSGSIDTSTEATRKTQSYHVMVIIG